MLLFIRVCVIPLLFVCDVVLINPANLQKQLSEASCWSFCRNQNLTNCQTDRCACPQTNIKVLEAAPNTLPLSSPTITCKDYNLASLIWEDVGDFAYFLEIWSKDKGRNLTEVTTCNSYILRNLQEDTVYKIRLWGVSYRLNNSRYSDEVLLTTINSHSMPLPVAQISLKSLKMHNDKYQAVVEWTPAADLSCYYHLLWFSGNEMGDYGEREILPGDRHQTTIDNLDFETNYSISIRAIRPAMHQESEPEELYVIIPSCTESFHSLTRCHPPPPENLVVHEKPVDRTSTNFLYDVILTWNKPELIPDHYIVHLRNIYPENQTNTRNIEILGNCTRAIFEKVELGMHYQVALTAFSPVGPSETVIQERHLSSTHAPVVSSKQSWTIPELILVIIGPLSAICLIVTLMYFVNHYRGKRDRKEQQRCKYSQELKEKSPESSAGIFVDLIDVDGPDEWELDPNKLFLQTVLGEGAFGVVRRAYLEDADGNRCEVAIKMLKDCPSPEEVRQFTHEIEIMKSVKKHPHVVSLIGCITRNRPEGPLLVVEYCSRGDLQTYLRTVWDHLTNRRSELQYLDDSVSSSGKYFANKTYDIQNIETEEFFIQPKQLISIALQVAMGMEHLARTRVVHRDLAARNVLVYEDRTVKVSDFGLSRDVYQDNVYCKTGGGKLPIRWMALESLTHQRYTTQSDVWSFGVLLWEIVTIGGTPYVGVHSRDLLVLLKNGHRLERPANCGNELYTIMQNCWKASPKDRPTFTELRQSLEKLLESVSHYLHLDVDAQYLHLDDNDDVCIYNNQRSQSLERYIKPTNNAR